MDGEHARRCWGCGGVFEVALADLYRRSWACADCLADGRGWSPAVYDCDCEVCGRFFEAKRSDARFCSGRCQALAYRRSHPRFKLARVCAVCRTPLAGMRSDALFCSGRCRSRAWRAKSVTASR